mmetsp:Transcript_110854/g.254020  ORF Transcript_110854/g.254020 Transcript_110854/m.254020 type:complete len:215 (-) Transcript_110854:288-932(-)
MCVASGGLGNPPRNHCCIGPVSSWRHSRRFLNIRPSRQCSSWRLLAGHDPFPQQLPQGEQDELLASNHNPGVSHTASYTLASGNAAAFCTSTCIQAQDKSPSAQLHGQMQTFRHRSAALQIKRHFGAWHRVVHFGVTQSSVLLSPHGSLGQYIWHDGASHSTWQDSYSCEEAFGHRVSHLGRWQSGSQSCSQAGVEHFQVQCGTQLCRRWSGTS